MKTARLLAPLILIVLVIMGVILWNSDLRAQDVAPQWHTPDGQTVVGDFSRGPDLGLTGFNDRGRVLFYAKNYLNDAKALAVVDTTVGSATLLPLPVEGTFGQTLAVLPGGPNGSIAWVYQDNANITMMGVFNSGGWVLPPMELEGKRGGQPALLRAGRWDGDDLEWVLHPGLGFEETPADQPTRRRDILVRRVNPAGGTTDQRYPFPEGWNDGIYKFIGAHHDATQWQFVFNYISFSVRPRNQYIYRFMTRTSEDTWTIVRTQSKKDAFEGFGRVDFTTSAVLSEGLNSFRLTPDGDLVPAEHCQDGSMVVQGVFHTTSDGRPRLLPRCLQPDPHGGEAFWTTRIRDQWIGLVADDGLLKAYDYATESTEPIAEPVRVRRGQPGWDAIALFEDETSSDLLAVTGDGHLVRMGPIKP